MDPEARALVDHFGLAPLPVEGGWFRQTFRSPVTVPPGTLPDHPFAVPAGTAIVALFTDQPDDFSAMHVLTCTEVWHFYRGDPLVLVLLRPDGSSERVTMGNDPFAGDQVQVVVPAGVWMGAHVADGGRYSLIGCSTAPGYVDESFTLGARDELLAGWPEAAAEITRLTR
jgi:predicted cupin superfamily sugar epimerase